jgi:predicted MPP superfamily phosphohydrolase
MAKGLGRSFDLILAGHSHGGQIRLPFIGALIVPKGVTPYEHGFYETPGGPLYVNAGIGTYRLPLRWNCPPELTLVTI